MQQNAVCFYCGFSGKLICAMRTGRSNTFGILQVWKSLSRNRVARTSANERQMSHKALTSCDASSRTLPSSLIGRLDSHEPLQQYFGHQ